MFQNSETINMVFILFNYKRNGINYKKSNKTQKGLSQKENKKIM